MMTNVKPIPFSEPMARAIDQGRKTMTRRILKRAPEHAVHAVVENGWIMWEVGNPREGYRKVGDTPLPYCPGDLLWVREPWRTLREFDHLPPRDLPKSANIWFEADGEDPIKASFGKYRHARFMPRWASRFTLEVTEFRVERLQEISIEDARAEGVATEEWEDWRENAQSIALPEGSRIEDERDLFRNLWNSLHGADACWDVNPWVAVITFAVHRCNVNFLPAAMREPEPAHVSAHPA